MIATTCRQCGTDNPAVARFCMHCAAPLSGNSHVVAEVGQPEERRLVTVLFADLSGYTAMSERMDPEAVKSLVSRCLTRLGGEVERHGGRVDKYIGDNVMAVFGAPQAHGNDAERALHAALQMQAAMDEINVAIEDQLGFRLSLRIGINTGEVLAGRVGASYTVIGDAVNVAARLESAARPGSVMVGEGTVMATAETVNYRELTPLKLKGKATPVRAWEAVGIRSEVAAGTNRDGETAPFVGRAPELRLLEDALARAAHNSAAQIVVVRGETGVGKSRLLRELSGRLEKARFEKGRCQPYGGNPYGPLSGMFRSMAGIVDTDPASVAARKLRRLLTDHGVINEDERKMASALSRFLAIGSKARRDAPPASLSARVRRSCFENVATAIRAMAKELPLVFWLEDAHWADQALIELIDYMGEHVEAPLVLVMAGRDQLPEPRQGGGRVACLELGPLDLNDATSLASSLLRGTTAGSGAAATIARRAGGNPLFVEELCHQVTSGKRAEADRLPASIHSALTARLDSLPNTQRRLLQLASVAGDSFLAEMFARLPLPEDVDLRAELASLLQQRVLTDAGPDRLVGGQGLAFSNGLMREVAYDTLPKADRARVHLAMGQFIEDRAGDRAAEVAALIADHYRCAALLGGQVGLGDGSLEPVRRQAVESLLTAGDLAFNAIAFHDAATLYERAEELTEPGGGSLRARVIERCGDVDQRLGSPRQAIARWEEPLEYHRTRGAVELVASLEAKIANGMVESGDAGAGARRYQSAIDALSDVAPSAQLVAVHCRKARAHLQEGNRLAAEEAGTGMVEALADLTARRGDEDPAVKRLWTSWEGLTREIEMLDSTTGA